MKGFLKKFYSSESVGRKRLLLFTKGGLMSVVRLLEILPVGGGWLNKGRESKEEMLEELLK